MNIHSENFEVYFKVPFYKRKIAKALKLWWNPDKKQWFKRFKACDYDMSEFQQSEFDIGKLIDSFDKLLQFDFIECKFNMDFKHEKQFNIYIQKVYERKHKNWLDQKWVDDCTLGN